MRSKLKCEVLIQCEHFRERKKLKAVTRLFIGFGVTDPIFAIRAGLSDEDTVTTAHPICEWPVRQEKIVKLAGAFLHCCSRCLAKKMEKI